MRKLMLTVLLASSAAMPALAQDRDFGGRRDRGSQEHSSEQRSEAREARRAQRAERPQAVERERRQSVERSTAGDNDAERQRAVEQRAARQAVMQQRGAQGQERQRGERGTWTQRRGDGRRTTAAPYADNGQVLSQQRDFRRDGDQSVLGYVTDPGRNRDGQIAVNRDGRRDGRYQSRYPGNTRQWSNQWRSDRSYDWRRYRDRNRSVFRLGNYYDPYGSRYRRFSIGFSLFPSYYQSNYWLDDPWMYRLPPAYGPYRWVRYYDDALLVNIYTGQVVDVVHGFFW